MKLIAFLYWLCILVIVYHHIAYPILLRYLGRRQSCFAAAPAPGTLPAVTLIIPCHNEAAVIARKIQNVTQLAYPRERLSVILALDGCTDDTRLRAETAIGELVARPDIRIVEYAQNVGKVAVLNEQIEQVANGIVALSDASALIPCDALIRAATHFADPAVGVVCPTYALGPSAEKGEQAYWTYQRRLKAAEGKLAAPMGAHGALYFFRRRLWEPLQADVINDDFILPMRIVLQGYRAVYDEDVVAAELERTAAGQDFRRRVRIGAGNMQQLLQLLRLGDPRRGKLALVFISGKALRALMPFILALALLFSGVLAAAYGGIYVWLLAVKLTLLFVALLGCVSRRLAQLPLFSHIAYAVSGHVASGLGAVLLLGGRHSGVWNFSNKAKSVYSPALRQRG